MLRAYVSAMFDGRVWWAVSAHSGFEIEDVDLNELIADFPNERVIGPKGPIDVLEWCRNHQHAWWLDSLGQPVTQFRKETGSEIVHVWYGNGMRRHSGDASFASIQALQDFLELDLEIIGQIKTAASGTRFPRNPGAKESAQPQV
jgi:hypothetical protein